MFAEIIKSCTHFLDSCKGKRKKERRKEGRDRGQNEERKSRERNVHGMEMNKKRNVASNGAMAKASPVSGQMSRSQVLETFYWPKGMFLY